MLNRLKKWLNGFPRWERLSGPEDELDLLFDLTIVLLGIVCLTIALLI